MSCIGIEEKVRAFRDARAREWGDLRGACRRKHVAALKRERRMLAILAKSGEPMTLEMIATAMSESVTTIYSTVLRLRARGAIVSAQREHSRAHAHALKRRAA